jgi:hypothetical protein
MTRTKDEALKLAAEFDKRFTSMNGVDVPERVSVPRDEWRALSAAIKQSLAAPTVQEPVAYLFTNVQSGDIEASTDPDHKEGEREMWYREPLVRPLAAPPPAQDFTCSTGLCHYKAQPAPVQEPVAYVETKKVHGHMCCFLYRHDSTKLLLDGTQLYTTPPAAQPAAQEFTCSTGLCHYKALPDAIHHTDLSEHPEYISGWNDYRAAMMEMMK